MHLSSLSPKLTGILCLLTVNYVSGITVKELFPFGPDVGDTELLQGDYAWNRITLQRPITTFGVPTNHIEVAD